MIRDLTIHPVLNGFVVQVGCQQLVFTDRTTMAREIDRYYENPETVEKAYVANAVNKTLEAPATLGPSYDIGAARIRPAEEAEDYAMAEVPLNAPCI